MKTKAAMAIWGLVLLVGFWASDYVLKAGYSEAYLWVAWGIILNVMNYAVGKTMKKMSKDTWAMWAQIGVFAFLITLAMAANLITISFAWLMSLWFILMGAAMFAGSYKANNPTSAMIGIIYIFTALFVPPTGYFVYGSLVFGLLSLVNTYFMKE